MGRGRDSAVSPVLGLSLSHFWNLRWEGLILPQPDDLSSSFPLKDSTYLLIFNSSFLFQEALLDYYPCQSPLTTTSESPLRSSK